MSYACSTCARISPDRRCPAHQRGNARARGYGPRFEAARAQLLSKQPTCRCGRPASVAHHNPPRRTLIALGADPEDLAFLEALCRHCHAAETAAGR